MRPTGLFRSLGASLVLLWLGGAGPAVAQSFATGQQAYAARDWRAAEEIWIEEAKAGSAEALLGLGNLSDFGLTGEADPEKAFGYYFEAAKLGQAEAAFNVAVMYDSGVGVGQDRKAAATWYSFAALDQFPRAQFNLGQIYAMGDGVPKNPAIAKLWFDQAAGSVPAAAEALTTLDAPVVAGMVAPEPLQIVVMDMGDETEARFAWLAAPGPEGAVYRVELIPADQAREPKEVVSAETTLSAVALPLDRPADQLAWRVLQITPDDYAASDWQLTTGGRLDVTPALKVRFEFFEEDRRGRGYAERVGASLARSGAVVTYDMSGAALEASAVEYRFTSDAPLARQIADFLPAVAGEGPTQSTDAALAPGEIRVRFVFE